MKRLPILLFFCCLPFAFASAQEYTDREEIEKNPDLKRDFDVQGEYLFETDNQIVRTENSTTKLKNSKIAMQVIAQGKGEFHLNLYFGGLPGDGWKKETGWLVSKGTLKDDNSMEITPLLNKRWVDGRFEETKEHLPPSAMNLSFEKDKLIASPGNDEMAITFKKIERKSKTLGAKAPDGGLIIFDGANLDQFAPGAKINEKTKTLWSDATTKPQDGRPYTLHVEFMLSYMPEARGQARSNSGVYFDERYECQVLDSFGLNGENNECGGFYSVKSPDTNLCYPPMTWQTYDIVYTPAVFENGKKTKNARATIQHNGVVIHEDMEFPHATTAAPKQEGPEPGGIHFQGHGNKVQYRNIWLKYKD